MFVVFWIGVFFDFEIVVVQDLLVFGECVFFVVLWVDELDQGLVFFFVDFEFEEVVEQDMVFVDFIVVFLVGFFVVQGGLLGGFC